jgi:hypothetical protein
MVFMDRPVEKSVVREILFLPDLSLRHPVRLLTFWLCAGVHGAPLIIPSGYALDVNHAPLWSTSGSTGATMKVLPFKVRHWDGDRTWFASYATAREAREAARAAGSCAEYCGEFYTDEERAAHDRRRNLFGLILVLWIAVPALVRIVHGPWLEVGRRVEQSSLATLMFVALLLAWTLVASWLLGGARGVHVRRPTTTRMSRPE